MTIADVIGSILVGGFSAWFGAWFALNQWRVERIGTRQAEFAEEMLTDLYRIRDEAEPNDLFLIYSILSKTGDEARIAEFRRSTREKFREVLVKRHRFEALFDKEKAKPLYDLAILESRIFNRSTRGLLRMPIEKFGEITSDASTKMDEIIACMEATCRAAIFDGLQQRSWRERFIAWIRPRG